MTTTRTSYEEIGFLIFSNCQAYCRHKIQSKQRWLSPDEELEISYAYEQLDNAFNLPIERLMLEVLVLIQDAGRGNNTFFLFHKENILSIMYEKTTKAQISELPIEEQDLLLSDMKILGLTDLAPTSWTPG